MRLMLGKLKDWFSKRRSAETPPQTAAPPKRPAPSSPRPSAATGPSTATKKVPRPAPEFVEASEDLSGDIESVGPGKNVLIRNKFLREDTGTHETLKILDDSIVDSGEETGIDPYNTGGFDRSKNWDKRFGK